MLMFTYAFVALTVEQKKVQGRLLELRQEVQREKNRKFVSDESYCESVLLRFMQLEEACRNRNLELFVVPALSSASDEAGSLLQEFHELTNAGKNILQNMCEQAQHILKQGASGIEELCSALELYCQNLSKRLEMEEKHILPLAQRAISSAQWFDIAAQFISHEAEKHDKHARRNEKRMSAFAADDDTVASTGNPSPMIIPIVLN